MMPPCCRGSRKRRARPTHKASGDRIGAQGSCARRVGPSTRSQTDLPEPRSFEMAPDAGRAGQRTRSPVGTETEEIIMGSLRPTPTALGAAACAATLAIAASAPAHGDAPNMSAFADPTGIFRTYDVEGAIDRDNLFFQSLGTNGRSCGSC